MMRLPLLISVTVLTAVAGFAQETPVRLDSITVSAGIPGEVLRLERECDSRIRAGIEALRRGDIVGATAALEAALRLVESNPGVLDSRQVRVLESLSQSYLRSRQPAQAVPLLERRIAMCGEGEADAGCAAAMRDLALAHIGNRDYQDALPVIREAASAYAAAAEESLAEEVRMGFTKGLAESLLVESIALLQCGQRPAASKRVESARKLLKGIEENDRISESLRADARRILETAIEGIRN